MVGVVNVFYGLNGVYKINPDAPIISDGDLIKRYEEALFEIEQVAVTLGVDLVRICPIERV